MKLNPLLTVLSAAAIGFFIGVSFPVQITPKVFPLSFGDGNCTFGGSYILGRLSTAFRNSTSTVEGTPVLQPNATSEDTPTRKYLLVLTVGYSDKVNVNATVHKFSENFDVLLFHYDGRTTEWDEFEWSKEAIHVSARKQAKWWYAKRFLHPSIVAPYEYIFIWDQDLGTETFDAEEYIKIVKKHGLEISQPGMDITRGVKTYDVNVRRNDTEIHTSTSVGKCSEDVHKRPCSAFVEVNAPVFTREAWSCVWHMIQSDLVHGWGLDWNFWRCVDEPEEQIGIVDTQYVAHHRGFTLGNPGNETVDGSRRKVRLRASAEFGMFKARLNNADKLQAAALLAQSGAATPTQS
uniref:Storage protein n=1 Tax=Setaria italica TaxID=4555 RepID=K3YNE4_SETIT